MLLTALTALDANWLQGVVNIINSVNQESRKMNESARYTAMFDRTRSIDQ